MSDILSFVRGVFLLDVETYARLRDSRNVMRTGILILLVAFLIAGAVQFVIDLNNNLRPFSADEAADIQAQIMQSMQPWLQFMPEGDEFSQVFMDQFLQNMQAGFGIGAEIDSLPTPLGRGLSVIFPDTGVAIGRGINRFLTTLGSWLSKPFAHLGAFLAYGIWVLLFARIMGGAGGIDRFFGVTALYAIPHMLGFLSPMPYVGWMFALLGFIWAIAVYVRGVQVTQRLDVGRSVLATFLPLVLLLLIGMLLAMFVLLTIIFAGN
jgi:hypothetical protein